MHMQPCKASWFTNNRTVLYGHFSTKDYVHFEPRTLVQIKLRSYWSARTHARGWFSRVHKWRCCWQPVGGNENSTSPTRTAEPLGPCAHWDAFLMVPFDLLMLRMRAQRDLRFLKYSIKASSSSLQQPKVAPPSASGSWGTTTACSVCTQAVEFRVPAYFLSAVCSHKQYCCRPWAASTRMLAARCKPAYLQPRDSSPNDSHSASLLALS